MQTFTGQLYLNEKTFALGSQIVFHPSKIIFNPIPSDNMGTETATQPSTPRRYF